MLQLDVGRPALCLDIPRLELACKRQNSANSKSSLGMPWNLVLVPRRGLEPPHPCEYMHLKHARLPIPPSGHGLRVGACLFSR